MLIESLKPLYELGLKNLQAEMESFKNEENIWKTETNISNSAGNLCLHIIGNLKHFLGAQIAKTNYIRQRELEFSSKNISRSELVTQIAETIKIVDSSLNLLTESELGKEYPIVVFSEKSTTEYIVVGMLTHLNYHLGQINYLRRILEK